MISTKPSFTTSASVLARVKSGALAGYALVWRQRQLLVSLAQQPNHTTNSDRVQNPDQLTECLKRSPVRLVKLELPLGETILKRWCDAATRAGKAAYLRIPTAAKLPQRCHPMAWRLKLLCDRLVAGALILSLSPVLLLVAAAIKLYSPGPLLFKQWRVGARGKLFQILKFRTMVVDAEQLHSELMGNQTGLHKLKHDPRVTPLGQVLRKYSLDELPQLFNVLRGEMSLVGPRPWALYDALRVPNSLQHRLNALPGITGAWQVEGRSEVVDLTVVNHGDLQYLKNWSLVQDLKYLALTVPRVLTGSGAY
jgi:lipopolysaccharide/colanic/teichoic acid biosynthesis glycosyltransferase